MLKKITITLLIIILLMSKEQKALKHGLKAGHQVTDSLYQENNDCFSACSRENILQPQKVWNKALLFSHEKYAIYQTFLHNDPDCYDKKKQTVEIMHHTLGGKPKTILVNLLYKEDPIKDVFGNDQLILISQEHYVNKDLENNVNLYNIQTGEPITTQNQALDFKNLIPNWDEKDFYSAYLDRDNEFIILSFDLMDARKQIFLFDLLKCQVVGQYTFPSTFVNKRNGNIATYLSQDKKEIIILSNTSDQPYRLKNPLIIKIKDPDEPERRKFVQDQESKRTKNKKEFYIKVNDIIIPINKELLLLG